MKKLFPLLIPVALLLGGCAKEVTIAQIKGKTFEIHNNPFGPDYEVQGVLVTDPVPYLVSEPNWYGVNMPVPEKDFILLSVAGGSKNTVNPNKYDGKRVRVTGNLRNYSAAGDSSNTDEPVFEANGIETVTGPAPCCSTSIPKLVDFCNYNPALCNANPVVSPRKFAILYSGGYENYFAAKRYWNDLVFMYKVLRYKYGFKPENIIVVYKDGMAENANTVIPVDAKADYAGVSWAFSQISAKIGTPTADDMLFVMVTNHGGQTNDLSGDDGNPDEFIYFYDQPSGAVKLLDEDFNSLLNTVPASVKKVCVFGQCFGGGFLKDCKGLNRINISASGENESSYGLCNIQPCMRYDEFVYYFTVALYGKYFDGTAIAPADNPDKDGNGKVSVFEAYWFAKTRDLDCCTHLAPAHLLDDDADGLGTDFSSFFISSGFSSSSEGTLSSTTYFE